MTAMGDNTYDSTSSRFNPSLPKPAFQDICQEIPPHRVTFTGLLGEYMLNTRQNRLKRIIDHPLILQGFKLKNISYPWAAAVPFRDASWEGNAAYAWIGEHVGKWLHAATVLGLTANDDELLSRVHTVANELTSYQEPNGYLGTYAPQYRITAPVGPHSATSWDVWTHRYNMVGLLTAYRYLATEKWLAACIKMGDLLLHTYGLGKGDITSEGTRSGLSALTILESVVLLYNLTHEQRYLELASHFIYTSSEQRTCVLSHLLEQADLTTIGSGKAYQLMSVLLGVLELYRCTGDVNLKRAVIYAWQTIYDQHLHITGGPWSKRVGENTNRECFAPSEHWSPEENVETCATVTWMQLNFSLFRLTGEAKYADEAERSLYNHLLGSQLPNGREGAYFTSPNERNRLYTERLDCCNSSRPRALSLVATHTYTYRENGLSINVYTPSRAHMHLNGSELTIWQETDYPHSGRVRIILEPSSPTTFPLSLRIPSWVQQYTLKINGKPVTATSDPGTYLCLNQHWQKGDMLEVAFTMPVKIHTRYHAHRVLEAVTTGPLVLAYSGTEPLGPTRAASVIERLVPYYHAAVQSRQVTTWFSTDNGGDAV